MSDPFDNLDDGEDREGDPFADFEEVANPETAEDPEDDGSAGGSPTDADDPDADAQTAEPDPFEYLGDTAPGVPDTTEADDDEPDRADAETVPGEQVDVSGVQFGEIDVSRGDPFESAESPFQEVDVTEVDPDTVWERFTEDSAGEATVESAEHDVVVVSKHEFCRGCPHFSPPPEVKCTHQGTSIREFLDPDEVRVENCPIVRERRELGESH